MSLATKIKRVKEGYELMRMGISLGGTIGKDKTAKIET
jgi:hypothetical protein